MNRSNNTIDGPIGSHITVNKQPDGQYKASASGFPSAVAIRGSEVDAINAVKNALLEAAAKGEI